ncbi:TSUP family transporter [Deefgea sp. CFH1-16]|uniref:sulfite exporter TauE/SafE family protein n=1 Tax=Deefgea sp. CFH1-16 TaxID=2675457 RepID=UPI0015F3E30B|nr:TSUP family transporter [Deefgea sp. CFH1-16]MBM5574320.1 TSUP family transporter [Deefgea sp. CFH1-16]
METALFLLVPMAFIAGLIDAAVGGGGLILLPSLLTALPKELPAALLGSNKFTAVWGTASAAFSYVRRIRIPWKVILPAAATAFIGSLAGARITHYLPADIIRPLVIVLLAIMLIYTWRKPNFGEEDAGRILTRRDLILGMVMGAAIGFYDGLLGPGTGSFLMFLFVRFFHFDFLRASASAKIVNLATNIAALLFFIPAKLVLFSYAIPMAIANIAGAQVGSYLAFRGGNAWIRRLFLILAVSLLAKLIWQQYH